MNRAVGAERAMKVVIAPDSFKEAMTAVEAAAAMARGVLAVVPDAEVVDVPMSDGGEGFTEAVAATLGARVRAVGTVDALGRPVTGRLAIGDGTAVLEMASAAGLELVPEGERDVLGSDTRGVGRMIRAALDAGIGRLLLGIGGSATNDGGAGMLAELGVRFLDRTGRVIGTTPRELTALASVDASGLDPRLEGLTIDVACDVDNPLSGDRGASAVFGPQKGAGPQDIDRLDSVLSHWADLSGHAELAGEPGAGAAGGLGFALMSFLGARLEPGIDLVARTVGLAEAVDGADLVITGEGSVDAQTPAGKVPAGVTRIAAAHGAPTVVVAGRVRPGAEALLASGCVAIMSTSSGEVVPLAEALRTAPRSTERAVATAMRLWTHGARAMGAG